LELESVSLAALFRSENELRNRNKALDAHNNQLLPGKDALQEDLLLHLAIAKAAGKVVMNMFMIAVTPQIFVDFKKYHVDCNSLNQIRINVHEEVYEAINNQASKLAKIKI
jgi:GntR family transcriptional repressor for pyruvate dehydrogenase complex